jgi:hypothetical protein
MSNVGPYGVTQNADSEAITANALVGSPAGSVTAHEAGAGFSQATFSTAPYLGGPGIKRSTLVRRVSSGGIPLCIGQNNTCGNWRVRDSDYCRWHG